MCCIELQCVAIVPVRCVDRLPLGTYVCCSVLQSVLQNVAQTGLLWEHICV